MVCPDVKGITVTVHYSYICKFVLSYPPSIFLDYTYIFENSFLPAAQNYELNYIHVAIMTPNKSNGTDSNTSWQWPAMLGVWGVSNASCKGAGSGV